MNKPWSSTYKYFSNFTPWIMEFESWKSRVDNFMKLFLFIKEKITVKIFFWIFSFTVYGHHHNKCSHKLILYSTWITVWFCSSCIPSASGTSGITHSVGTVEGDVAQNNPCRAPARSWWENVWTWVEELVEAWKQASRAVVAVGQTQLADCHGKMLQLQTWLDTMESQD